MGLTGVVGVRTVTYLLENKTQKIGLGLIVLLLGTIVLSAPAAAAYPTKGYYMSMNGQDVRVYYNTVGASKMHTYSGCYTVAGEVLTYAKNHGVTMQRTRSSIAIELGIHVYVWEACRLAKLTDSTAMSRSNPADIDYSSAKNLDYISHGKYTGAFSWTWFTSKLGI